MKSTIVIAHNLRSTHNVGSILRTAEGLGLERVYLTGYTPYPALPNDPRLPHLKKKIDNQIHKTALGAESMIDIIVEPNIDVVLNELKKAGYIIVALEQRAGSTDLKNYKRPDKIALIVGREVEGIEQSIIEVCDEIVEIPMRGQKESFNVVQAAAMALYQLML